MLFNFLGGSQDHGHQQGERRPATHHCHGCRHPPWTRPARALSVGAGAVGPYRRGYREHAVAVQSPSSPAAVVCLCSLFRVTTWFVGRHPGALLDAPARPDLDHARRPTPPRCGRATQYIGTLPVNRLAAQIARAARHWHLALVCQRKAVGVS